LLFDGVGKGIWRRNICETIEEGILSKMIDYYYAKAPEYNGLKKYRLLSLNPGQ
jgi:hypothetical protein